jgi:uncharacterized membrane protein (DUF4010 family)
VNPFDPNLVRDVMALGSALLVGLLVGVERGWQDRDIPDGGRVAGLRTFALIGLLGGVLGLVGGASVLPLAVGLLAIALFFAVSYRQVVATTGTFSITTAVAALATYALGALAASGHTALAISAAVIVAMLLNLKPVLHRWLRAIRPAEVNAALQLGVLSAVILPLLPDQGFGPYDAINPHQLWLAVIVVAALSLAGHAAMRLRGDQQGLMWMGLLGGLASSTAATLALSRLAAAAPQRSQAASAAIVAASGVMFLRMAALVGLLQATPSLRLVLLLVLLAVAAFALAAWQWPRGSDAAPADSGVPSPKQPAQAYDLFTALGFGVVLGVVTLATRAAHEGLGLAGTYAVAFVSGLADVDAIVIASVQMDAPPGAVMTAVAILLAAFSNSLVKAGMCWAVAGRAVGSRVAFAYLALFAVGAVTIAIQGV